MAVRVEPFTYEGQRVNGFAVMWDRIDEHLLKELIQRSLELAAEKLAEQFIEVHGQEILAAIRPEAIATMALAEAGAAVNDTLKKKLPDKVLEVTRREVEVYERGWFGGTRRIR